MSPDERSECETDDDADVNKYAYELNETADDSGSDAELLLIRRHLLERASDKGPRPTCRPTEMAVRPSRYCTCATDSWGGTCSGRTTPGCAAGAHNVC